MQLLLFTLLMLFACGCNQIKKEKAVPLATDQKDTSHSYQNTISYSDTKKRIADSRKNLATHFLKTVLSNKSEIAGQIKDCWIDGISNDLYKCWAGTPWDFNGTTLIPKQGTIACGYFVTTLLQDMGLQISRIRFSTCAASVMMQKLVPHQAIQKLNSLSYNQFCDFVRNAGKGVFIIGLDYHVGFIVNDGQNCWFIHSNYINKQGVIKEPVQYSTALQASNTRWLISLTNDKNFIAGWLAIKN